MIHDSDQLLLRKVKNGNDYGAFEAIFNKYYESLKTWSLYVVGNESLAEEAVMDVFMKLWISRKKIRINTSLKSYLFTAVKNQSIDYIRKDLQKQVFATSADIKSDAIQPDEWLNLTELQSKIEGAIEDLPEQCRKIFRMSRDDGMKYKEIADELNISIKTVETQIGRALLKLKKAIYNH